MDYETITNNTSHNVNRELLFMSGLNCTMWVYVTKNVPVTEVQYAVPCEVCFVSDEYTATREAIFILSMESPARFLAWTKIRRTLYRACTSLQTVQEQQLFMDKPPH
jgi:hypothetical protein